KQRYSLIQETKFDSSTLTSHFIYASETGSSPGPVPVNPSFKVVFDRMAFLGGVHYAKSLNENWNLNVKSSLLQSSNENTQSGATTVYKTRKIQNSFATDYQIDRYNNIEVFTDFITD